MPTKNAQDLILHCSKLKAERHATERHWREIAAFMRPQQLPGLLDGATGPRRSLQLFDSTPQLAAENFASGIYGMMTNPANRWFALKLQDEALVSFDPVRDWLYDVETRILDSFGPQSSRFYAVLPSLYADLACFGTAVFYSEEVGTSGHFNDSVRPLAECLFAENAYGEIDTVFRRFRLTPRQALSLFGDAVSTHSKRAAEKNSLEKIAFIHSVIPNDDPAAMMPFTSVYLEEDACLLVGKGAYFDMPYQIPRWSCIPGEVYGRGIGDQILPDARLLMRMEETALRAAELMADPPMAVNDKGLARGAHTRPGGVSYGALDQDGQLRIKPIYTGANPTLAIELIEKRRQSIREAFHFSLLQLAGSPTMTATEFIGRQEEKLRLLGPNLGRIQSEFLSPLIKRRFGLLLRAGLLPEPPPEVRGEGIHIGYVSPLARAQMAGEAQAVARLYESLSQLAAIDPTVVDNVDHDEAVQVIGRGWAVPGKIMRGADQVQQLRSIRQGERH